MANSHSTQNQVFATEFVQEHIDRALAEQRKQTINVIQGYLSRQPYESPLEAAYAVWWVVLGELRGYEFGLVPQQEVVADGEHFRLDFAVERAGVIRAERPSLMLAVELDGHEFHERTKGQVALRNRRDRRLVEAGWRVLHFSGSEFHRDPAQCIDETYRAAVQRLWGVP